MQWPYSIVHQLESALRMHFEYRLSCDESHWPAVLCSFFWQAEKYGWPTRLSCDVVFFNPGTCLCILSFTYRSENFDVPIYSKEPLDYIQCRRPSAKSGVLPGLTPLKQYVVVNTYVPAKAKQFLGLLHKCFYGSAHLKQLCLSMVRLHLDYECQI